MLAVPRAEIDRRGRPLAVLAPQTGKDFRKSPVAAIHRQQAQRKDRRTLAAVKLQAAVRPVGQAMRKAERRRVHDRRLSSEHKANNNEESQPPRSESLQVAARILSISSTAFAAQPSFPAGTSGRNLS